jgi:hypothetical protein
LIGWYAGQFGQCVVAESPRNVAVGSMAGHDKALSNAQGALGPISPYVELSMMGVFGRVGDVRGRVQARP